MGSTLVSLSWWDWDEEKICRSLPAIMSGELDAAINEAEKKAAEMKDEFVSVEHLMMGLISKPDRKLRDIFSRCNVNYQAFLTALKSV